jgi:hypothetical protein
MFKNANSFNQPLNNWNVENVESTDRMFENAIQFNQDLSGWRLNNIRNNTLMFNGSAITEEHKPLSMQGQNRPRQQVNPTQIHRVFAKINLDNLINTLNNNNSLINLPEISGFSNFIKTELTSIVNNSFTDSNEKQNAMNGINQIMQQRLDRLNYADFPLNVIKAVYLSLLYIKDIPSYAQKEYINTFIHDCTNAYDGRDGMTCAAGGVERIVKLLEVACASMITSNPDNTGQCKEIIAILNGDYDKLIQEAALDWYKEHKKGTPGEFPSTVSIEDKILNLREYLLAKFPGIPELIDRKIEEFKSSIGFEEDDFTYGGRKRTRKLRKKYSKIRRTKRQRKLKKTIKNKHKLKLI